METQRLLSVREVAKFLRVSVPTIYGWVYMRRIPFLKAGRLLRFDSTAIDHWLKHGDASSNGLDRREKGLDQVARSDQ